MKWLFRTPEWWAVNCCPRNSCPPHQAPTMAQCHARPCRTDTPGPQFQRIGRDHFEAGRKSSTRFLHPLPGDGSPSLLMRFSGTDSPGWHFTGVNPTKRPTDRLTLGVGRGSTCGSVKRQVEVSASLPRRSLSPNASGKGHGDSTLLGAGDYRDRPSAWQE